MSKPKEYWIRQGTNGFSYKVLDEDTFGEIGLDLGVGDCFYDSVITEPAKNSIHVIEYSAYEKLQEDYNYIRREWESACERAEYNIDENIKLTGQVAMLHDALDRLGRQCFVIANDPCCDDVAGAMTIQAQQAKQTLARLEQDEN